jgi:hypothetical protein
MVIHNFNFFYRVICIQLNIVIGNSIIAAYGLLELAGFLSLVYDDLYFSINRINMEENKNSCMIRSNTLQISITTIM